ncbi:MAG TPA: DUF4097 family beta strand repeat-containing protein [Dermatophilaceae bacterium]|nr:DUF4097 family beta strand repeat-containing protein [Dermatophilaceae bacterium]
MPERWQIDKPKVIDIGSEQESVIACKVALVGGRVDIVTHDDSPTARVEVHEVGGRPLEVSWNGSTLRVSHVKDHDSSLWDSFLHIAKGDSKLSARVSISVPATALVTVSTVSADALLNGFRASVKGNTVSGVLTIDDVQGEVKANTVSGEIECHDLRGDLHANTVSGAITVQQSTLPNVRLNTVTGDIALDLRNRSARVSSNSVSGDVTVRVPAGEGYDVTAHTASGDVVIDGRSMRGEQGQRGGQLREGDGGLVVRANSVSGSVVVLRAGSSPQPPHVGSDSAVQDTPPTAVQDTPPAPPAPQTGPATPAVPPTQEPAAPSGWDEAPR